MSLNPDQQAAVAWALQHLLERRAPALTLVGAGGTGKTFCVMTVAERLLAAGLKVLFTAPTNKAVKQLEKAAREHGLPRSAVAFMTAHSALGLALLPNEDQKFAVRAGKGVLEGFDVMVVDEASMLSRYALDEHLLPDAARYAVQLLFMGDDLQLPPVKEPVSPVFQRFPQFRLEHNERQQPGELLTVTGVLRTAMRANRPFQAPAASGEQIQAIQAAHFLRAILDAFDIDTDLDRQRVLAWSNRRVDQINAAIRHKLYGADCAPFVVGERVVTGAPVKDAEGQIVLGTDEECDVHHVDPDSQAAGYRTVRLVLEPRYLPGQVVVEVLHAAEQARFQAQLDTLAEQARDDKARARRLWAQFWTLKETFADMRHCYCTTVHRSQGSTFDRVFVDVKDILRNANRIERQRLLNVGYSRPRHQLLINKARYVA